MRRAAVVLSGAVLASMLGPVAPAIARPTLGAAAKSCSFLGGQLTAGEYAGSFSLRLNVTAPGANLVLVVSGPLSLTVEEVEGIRKVTGADGEFRFGIEGSEVGGSLSGAGGGPLTFEKGDLSSFTMKGSADVASTFSGDVASGSGTGSGESSIAFQITDSSCTDVQGSITGQFIDETRRQVGSAGATSEVIDATWSAARADEGGRPFSEVQEEVRSRAQEIADRAMAVTGRRTVNDLLEFRKLQEEITGGKLTKDKNAQHCLLKILMEIYFPVAEKWQKDDVKEMQELAKTATNDADLARLRRLMAQVIYRDREAQLAGCDRFAVLDKVGAAAETVARRLAKMKFFDQESVAEALSWGRAAQLLNSGNDDGGVMAAAEAWAKTRWKDQMKRLYQALKNKAPTPEEYAAIAQLVKESRAIEQEARTLGAIRDDEAVVDAEVTKWCETVKGGCS